MHLLWLAGLCPLQVSGEALYTDDLPVPAGCLEGALILASQANAKIVSVNIDAALAVPGVVSVQLAKDIKGACLFTD